MGYDVRITHSDLIIEHQVKDQVLQIWKELNNPENNDLKDGGGYSGNQRTYWYSWMLENYDKTCNSVEEILKLLGFDFTLTEKGIFISGYNRKTGQEELFFQHISHLIEGEISWIGEDDITWTWYFDGVPQLNQITQ